MLHQKMSRKTLQGKRGADKASCCSDTFLKQEKCDLVRLEKRNLLKPQVLKTGEEINLKADDKIYKQWNSVDKKQREKKKLYLEHASRGAKM